MKTIINLKDKELKKQVEDLGHLASMYYLMRLGWQRRQIESAVRRGVLGYQSDGTLQVEGAK